MGAHNRVLVKAEGAWEQAEPVPQGGGDPRRL